MYIAKIRVEHIKSIHHFEVDFTGLENYAGWHVIIGDNGAGKSTLIKAIALGLIGPAEAAMLREDWTAWLTTGESCGTIEINLFRDKQHDKSAVPGPTPNPFNLKAEVTFKQTETLLIPEFNKKPQNSIDPHQYIWSNKEGWFSSAYGPFRRFQGGNTESSKLFYKAPKLGAHLTAFGEDVALTEIKEWLKELQFRKLENSKQNIIDDIKTLINSPGFLPNGVRLNKVTSKGVEFQSRDNHPVEIEQLSDGYRSILSLTFELLRQLIRVYGEQEVKARIKSNSLDLPGVVLIDEIDAHLHPTWQISIGQWFTKYFPQLQFIVTTHSPLVCRAASKGSIWRLGNEANQDLAGQVTGIEKDRLVYGNILDAYGTELFGKTPVRSEESASLLKRLGRLNMLAALGKITSDEESERNSLQKILSTDVQIGE